MCAQQGTFHTGGPRGAHPSYKTANHSKIAAEIGVSTNSLIGHLCACAEQVIGVGNARVGDLILEMDGRTASLVVRREFSALYAGGPKCLGIHGWTSPREYNLWENTDIPYPEHSRLVLLRAPAARVSAGRG